LNFLLHLLFAAVVSFSIFLLVAGGYFIFNLLT